ncbi:hypothetical protein AVEN_243989-1 [Araneus ventricosus]|uniref:DDE-1 domain-containing protein n=1 Tax=Araneus ventricosus TaxID=182803 RepID=A0A4Y2ILN1_ARAVE|nr:hypothetical protein AVEN_243989-1 [Araneus ventricosus]
MKYLTGRCLTLTVTTDYFSTHRSTLDSITLSNEECNALPILLFLDVHWIPKLNQHDETGLFFQCLPNKTAAFKGKEYHGGKQSKLRVTVLLAANQSGKEKLPTLMIGRCKKQRCLAKNFLDVDNELPTSGTMTDKDIVANICAEISDEENEELDQQEHEKVSVEEAEKAVELFRSFLESIGNIGTESIGAFRKNRAVAKRCMRGQTSFKAFLFRNY